MNFLKAKKFLFIFCISFFISCGLCKAETMTGEIHTTNSTREKYKNSINLFEEVSMRSNFAFLLNNQGYNLGNYLNDYYSIGDSNFFNSQRTYGISILNKGDLKYFSSYTNKHKDGYNSDVVYEFEDYDVFIKHLFTSEDSGFVKYHDIYYVGDNSFADVDNIIVFSTRLYSSSSVYGNLSLNKEYANLTLYPKYIFLFNSSGNSIGYIDFNYSGCNQITCCQNTYCNSYNSNFFTSMRFNFPYDLNSPGVNYDMTSWYAYAYKLSANSSNFDLIYPLTFIINGERVKVEDNAGYSGVSGWFTNLFYNHVDFSDWNMNFIYEDIFYKYGVNFIPLLDRWYDTSSYVVPDDYSHIDVSTSSKGYYLVPKAGCNSSDYRIYYSSASSIDKFRLYFNFYVNNNSKLDFYKTYHTISSKSYSIYSYQPLTDLAITLDEYLNYAINLTQSSLRFPFDVYYNPVCYSSSLSDSSDITLKFESGDVILSSNEQQDNFNNTSSSNNSSSPSSGSSNNNVTNNVITNFEVSSVISNIGSHINGITSSISSLVGITTVFLTGLPVEIYGVLFSVFTIGMIIFIIKLIK